MFDDLDDDQIELEEPIDRPTSDDDEEKRAEVARRKGMKKYTVGEVGDDFSMFFYCFPIVHMINILRVIVVEFSIEV